MRYNSLKLISHKTYSPARFSHTLRIEAMPWFIECNAFCLLTTRLRYQLPATVGFILSLTLPNNTALRH